MQEQNLVATGTAGQVTTTGTTNAPEVGSVTPVEKKRQVFLAWTPDDALEKRELVAVMLQKAGMEVFPMEPRPADEEEFKRKVEALVAKAECSVHVLGGDFGPTLQNDESVSYARYQYEVCTGRSRESKGSFKRISWSYPLEGVILQGEQQELITQIQNNLSSEVMFTNVANPAQLIEDIRAFLERDHVAKAVPKEYDMAFFSNVQDAADCYMTIEKLSEEYKLTTVTVVPENDTDYRALGAERSLKARLAVVFFKESSDWAVSFVKQVWKFMGGASSTTSFLIIGEDEPRRNRFLRYKAPNTLLLVVKPDEVLESIKATYTRFRETGRIIDETFCPYTGLRPFNEDESIFFKGRDKHNDYIIEMISRQKFAMVTGSSGDGKSSLVFAGVIPTLKGGFLKTQFTKWAVADFRPERQPLRNMALALSREMRLKDIDEVENSLSYGFSALVDLYKKSPLYCDMTSPEWLDANEEDRKSMKRRAANLLVLVDQFEEFFTNVENYRDGVASPISQITVNVLIETIRIAREENLPIYVVCTMRSDYIGQCVAFRGFAEMIGLSTYYVPRLKRDEVQEVIQAPAQLNGNKVSLRLAQRLLNDLGDGIDQLPVLQHSLHQIWTNANKGAEEMDLIHYAQVGGLASSKLPRENMREYDDWFKGIGDVRQSLYEKPRLKNVLNRHANELYEFAHDYYNARYSPPIAKEVSQAIIRTAFTCLTKIDDNRAVRNRMTLQQITEIHGKEAEGHDFQLVGRVLNIFREQGNTFVQPFISDDPESKELQPTVTLDITHESLIRNWERLVDWAEQEHKSVTTYSDFKVQVNRWLANDCDEKYLLSTGPYTVYNMWYEQQQPTPAWVRRYIRPDEIVPELDPMEQASLYLEDIQDFLEQSRRRINRVRVIRNIITGVIAILFVASLIATGVAVQNASAAEKQKEYAERQAAEAERQKKVAQEEQQKAEKEKQRAEEERRLADIARNDAERERQNAILQKEAADYAKLQAVNAATEAEKQRLLAEDQRKFAQSEKEAADKARKDAELSAAIAREQEENARTENRNAKILQSLFLSSLSRDQVKAGEPQLDANNNLTPPDRKRYEVGAQLAMQALPENLNMAQDKLSRPYVAEAEAALYYSMNALENAEPIRVLRGHTNKMIYNQFSPDSKLLISSSWDKTARVWDVASGKEVRELSGHTDIVQKAYFSQDGRYTVTLGDDFSARLWDFNTGRSLQSFKGHRGDVTHAAITADGQRVVTTSLDNTARLYDSQTGNLIADLTGHKAGVLFAAFSPDGKHLVTTSADKTAILWNGESGRQVAVLSGHGADVTHAAFSPDNNLLATVSDDNTGRIWNAETGSLSKILPRGTIATGVERNGHVNKVNFAAFSPDSRRLATTSSDSLALVWNVTEGNVVGVLKKHTERVYNVQFSNDGKFMLTTSDDRTVVLWDAIHYLDLAEYKGTPGLGYYAVFSPDSKYIATCGTDENDLPTTVRIFKLLPKGQDLMDFAKAHNMQELNEDQKKVFFLSDKRITKVQLQKGIDNYNDRMKMLKPGEKPVKMEDMTKPGDKPGEIPKNWWKGSSAAPSTPTEKRMHRVQAGETMWAISRRYNIGVDQLMEFNGKASSEVKTGEILIVQH